MIQNAVWIEPDRWVTKLCALNWQVMGGLTLLVEVGFAEIVGGPQLGIVFSDVDFEVTIVLLLPARLFLQSSHLPLVIVHRLCFVKKKGSRLANSSSSLLYIFV